MAKKVHTWLPWDFEVFVLLNAAMYLGLFVWSRMHYKSFQMLQFGGLLLMPLLINMLGEMWKFVLLWTIYVAMAAYIIRLAFQRPVLEHTPKRVYMFFAVVHQLCSSLFTAGILMTMVKTEFFMNLSVQLICLATYFGVVNRDATSIASERMKPAKAIGEGMKRSRYISANSCAICSMQLKDMEGGSSGGKKVPEDNLTKDKSKDQASKGDAATVTLPCRHSFHGYCIRGWTIVGKRNICPACGEKVDMMEFVKYKPWMATSYIYAFFLAFVRFLFVWFPLVFIFSGYGLYFIEKVVGAPNGSA
mmetsp:Transcript_11899/g.36262  ORF Transcript_11899/g.36262 Transcript_11899/m.36262 type:complete len:304 (+) Transcript_11899:123-1034(+)